MSKNLRRAKAEKRATTTPLTRPQALCWPDVLSKFADWLIRNDWATESIAAYSAAMAVDRSIRERKIVVVDAPFPLELFDVDEYLAAYVDDCGHMPWTNDDFVDAIGMFAKFVVAESVSLGQSDIIAEEFGYIGPIGNGPTPAVPFRLETPIGPIQLTSVLQRVAGWCEDNGSVPAACLAHPNVSSRIRDRLSPERDGGPNVTDELLSLIEYHLVIATALGTDILTGFGHELGSGSEFESWLTDPSQEQRHRCLIEAYSACLEPIIEFHNASADLQMSASTAGLWFTLVRSLVDDPVREGERLGTGTETDSDQVSSWITVRLAVMNRLGLIVPMNGKFCVPDSHAPALLEALDRSRR